MTEAMPFLQKAILLSYDPRAFGGDVNFIDTTNNLKQALDLSSMKEEGRVEFLRNNIVYEDGANVTCHQKKGLSFTKLMLKVTIHFIL